MLLLLLFFYERLFFFKFYNDGLKTCVNLTNIHNSQALINTAVQV